MHQLLTSMISQAAGPLVDRHPDMGGGYAYNLIEEEIKRNGVLDRLEFKLNGGAITETLAHIRRVQSLLVIVATRLITRAIEHDRSKLEEPERSAFEDNTHALKGLTYGSDEYKSQLQKLGPALQHHYGSNDHHPEFFTNGINGMSLLALMELACDWKAAGERHADGSFERSLEVNKDRFGMSDQLVQIFKNTAAELGWNYRPLP